MAFSGYSINGISLNDRTRGWSNLRSGTNTQGGITNALNKVPRPGRPGYNPGPKTFSEQIVVFVVRCSRASLESLLNLCAAATILTQTDDPTKELRVELASAIPNGDEPMDRSFDVTVTLSAYDGVWRDVANTDIGPVTIASPTQALTMLTGIGAPVSDMSIFIRGIFGQFTLTDSGGSFLKTTRAWTAGTATNGLLYVGLTGQAFLANESSPFVPVSDASQYIDTSGNGGFQLTPQLVSGNPTNRQVGLSLVTLTQTSTTLRVRAKRAFRMN